MDHIISELCYKGTILQRNCRKMTMVWSFSYRPNSLLKFHDKIIWEPKHDCIISKSEFTMRYVIKRLHYKSIY